MTPSLPDAMVPIPAAASPLTQSPKSLRGRVRVIASGKTRYLSDQTDNSSNKIFRGCCVTTTKLSDACVLSGTTGSGGIRFNFESLNPAFPSIGMHLGMVWQAADPLKTRATNAALTTVHIQSPNPTILNTAHWKGPVSWVTWTLLPDNTLTLKLKGMPEAGIATWDEYLLISSRMDMLLKTSSTWNEARLVFVPI